MVLSRSNGDLIKDEPRNLGLNDLKWQRSGDLIQGFGFVEFEVDITIVAEYKFHFFGHITLGRLLLG